MATAPDLTFRGMSAPYTLLSALSYVQVKDSAIELPVLENEVSDAIALRIYNNWALNSSIASATNVQITVYDGVGAGSHTQSQLPASQSWLRVRQAGFGESIGTPGLFTSFIGSDTAIGGTSKYKLQLGSDGSVAPTIRAGAAQNGVGFAQVTTYLQLPASVPPGQYNFSISVSYDWTS